MSTTNPQEEITKLEEELKKTQDSYLYAQNQMKSANETMENCRSTIIAIQAAIETHKKYMPNQEVTSGQPASWSEAG